MRESDDAVFAAIEEIYAAVGDERRLRDLEKRLASLGTFAECVRGDLELATGIHDEICSLTRKGDLLTSLQDQLSMGVLVVDARATILRANGAARSHLDAGIGVSAVGGCLRIDDPAAAAALAEALSDAAAEPRRREGLAERTISVARPGHRPLIVWVAGPMKSQGRILERAPEIVLLLLDSDGPASANLALLRELYGLTAREATVAALLVEGRSLDEASRELGVTKNTVRTLLKRATAKTNSHSQTGLVRRLLGLSLVLLD